MLKLMSASHEATQLRQLSWVEGWLVTLFAVDISTELM